MIMSRRLINVVAPHIQSNINVLIFVILWIVPTIHLLLSKNYVFVPVNTPILTMAVAAIWVFITWLAQKYSKVQSRFSSMITALLPLPTCYAGASVCLAAGEALLPACLIVSILTFVAIGWIDFRVKGFWVVKIIFAVMGLLLSMMEVLWVVFALLMYQMTTTVVQTTVSPNGEYVAWFVENNSGAVGGSTVMEVRRQTEDIHLLIGAYAQKPVAIYDGPLGQHLTLSFMNNDTLLVDGKEYHLNDMVK